MILKNKKVVAALGLLQILVLFLGLCFATISYKAVMFVGFSVLTFGIAIGLYCLIFCLSKGFADYYEQLHMVNAIMGIVIAGLLLNDWQSTAFPVYQKIILVIILASSLFCEFVYLKKNNQTELFGRLSNLKSNLFENAGLYLVLLIFLILSVHSGGTTYKWDSRLYYITCQELNAFSISNLAIYGHTAQTFGLLMKLGSVFFHNMNIAAHAMNVLVAMCGICAFYGIVKHFCRESGKLNLCLATGVYAFSAYTLGLVNYLNLDYYCACFFPVVVYFMLKRKWIFHIIAALFFCFTKEPAVIIYAGLCMAYLGMDGIQQVRQNGFGAIKTIAFSIKYWYMALVGILWFVIYRLLGPWSAGEGGVSFDPGFAWAKIKVMYLINFGWFFSILFLMAVIVTFRQKKKERYPVYIYLLIPLLVFTLFNCLFRTANHYRYNAIVMFILCLGSLLWVLDLQKKYLTRTVLVISCIVSLCSSYLSVDPLTDKLFGKVFVGNGWIWSTSDDLRLADSAIYNKQMLGAENALNQVFREAIADDDRIILQAENNNIWYADGLTDFLTLKENGSVYSFFWDEHLSQRTCVETETTRIIEIIQTADMEDILQQTAAEEAEKTYSYVGISDPDNQIFNEIQKRYSVIEEEEYQYGIWKFKRVRFEDTVID